MKPHDTPKEELFFNLAMHYKRALEWVLGETTRKRILYSDGLGKNIRLELQAAPGSETLNIPPSPIAGAPRDGRPVVLLLDQRPWVAVGKWSKRVGWIGCNDAALISPTHYLPTAETLFKGKIQ